MTKKAVIILVWIGKVPAYFPLWVRSVKSNSSFDFLLFTDQLVDIQTPDNLRVIRLTMQELSDTISRKLSLKINIVYPYKICEYKPAFGEIFSDYLAGYAFWGCCDVDLLFGNLEKFITDEILDSYKKVLVRGHLTLYRNETAVNAAYRSSKMIDHRAIFESQNCYYLFDEWFGIYRIFEELEIEQYHEEIMADIDVYNTRVVCTNIANFSKQIFVWQEGNVKQYYLDNGTFQCRELAYVHFQKRRIEIKDLCVFTSPAVIMSSNTFLPYSGQITAGTVRRYDTRDFGHYLNSQVKRVKKKISALRKNSILINNDLSERR
jgi:hypothetical protein